VEFKAIPSIVETGIVFYGVGAQTKHSIVAGAIGRRIDEFFYVLPNRR